MNLAEYYLLHGEAGLAALSAACPRAPKVGYLRQLVYSPGEKEPSLSLAVELCKASGGKLTCEHLSKLGALDHRTLRRKPKAAPEAKG